MIQFSPLFILSFPFSLLHQLPFCYQNFLFFAHDSSRRGLHCGLSFDSILELLLVASYSLDPPPPPT